VAGVAELAVQDVHPLVLVTPSTTLADGATDETINVAEEECNLKKRPFVGSGLIRLRK
jgi:hypothetical protein